MSDIFYILNGNFYIALLISFRPVTFAMVLKLFKDDYVFHCVSVPTKDWILRSCYSVKLTAFTVCFTKLLTNGFRSWFEIPEGRYELGNFIT